MKNKLHFEYLPAYADFLIRNKLKEFSSKQLSVMRELDVPLLKFYSGLTDEVLIDQGIKTTEYFLNCFRENTVPQYIDKSISDWLTNHIPLITREQLLPEDVTLISFTRRKAFRDFLPSYTSDTGLALKIMEEVDTFTVEIDTRCFKNLLTLQRSLYEQAEALAHIGSWSWEMNSKALIWSDELFRIYELDPVPDASIYDIKQYTHPEDQEVVQKAMDVSSANKEPHDFYYRIKVKSGKEKYLHAKGQPELDSQGVIVKMFGTLQDVTSQKLAEEKLIRSEELYHNMVSEIQDYAIILLDKQGNILNWNKGAEKIKGYSTDEIVGKNFSIFYTKGDQTKKLPETMLHRATVNGRATYEGWRKRKDGTVFYASSVITALHDKNGEITAFSKITRDLTERKSAEDRLIHYTQNIEMKNKKLEQANKELESFSYIASHDLQEPLRKIQAFTSRLLQKENDNLSEWGKDVFLKVQTSANRMQRLIEALLSFSRLDKTQEMYERTDIQTLYEDIKSGLHEIIEAQGAVIEADPLPVMDVIPVQFQQLLTNLISNSLKYSKEDVKPVIRITYGLKEGKHIPGNSALDLNKYHHICITDNGIGFEEQYSEKIFELFQRLHGKSEYEGTGIGLAICKKIVDNHHGFIYAKGEPGKGAEFNVFIPSERKAEIVNPFSVDE